MGPEYWRPRAVLQMVGECSHTSVKQFIAKYIEDPSKFSDIIPVGFGDDGMIDDELAEEGRGRRWNNCGGQWVNKEWKKDRFS